ncbi:MAG: bifunctional precorrin-2 dehydrogenase/sirohydrochlorin ferrochelatase [Phycisphaerae bacterium]|nr:bifunctional precorrin-2 dehydrogenase/sirohydrochlorin ferrochelatase [Phycisphaerae bacterium]
MKIFPIMLNLTDKRAVVVGGGPVGLRKAQALLRAGAKVTLVAPQVNEHPSVEDIAGIEIVREAYRPQLLGGAVLVFACTGERQLNRRIAADARRGGAIVNVADAPDECDFISPAVIQDGEVVVSVSTGGQVPALVHLLKDKLAAALPDRIGRFAALLGELRSQVRKKVDDPRRRGRIMSELADQRAFEMFRSDGPDAVRGMLDRLMRED